MDEPGKRLVEPKDEDGWLDTYPTIRDEVGFYTTANPWDAPGMKLSDFL